MKSIRRTKRVLLGCATAGLALLAAEPVSATNYLVIILDDVGVDKVGAYAADYPGYAAAASHLPDTQTIDSLAASGLRFTRAWAMPLCSPTRAAFQTGNYPFRSGIGTALGSNVAGLDTTAFPMLASIFQSNSFATGHFGKWHIGTENAAGNPGTPPAGAFMVAPHPSLAGFDRFFGSLNGAVSDYDNWFRVSWLGALNAGTAGTETIHATERTVDVAQQWINSRTSDWLAVVALNAAHTDSNGWDTTAIDSAGFTTHTAFPCIAGNSCSEREVYQALLENADVEIENLLNGITPSELDDTVIFLFGDNGTPAAVQEGDFDTAAAFGLPARGKSTTYENGIRVPLIVADGGTWRTGAAGAITSPGREVDALIETTDVYQTLANHGLMFSVANVDSTSFVDCFTDTGQYCGWSPRRYGYSETFRRNGMAVASARIAVHYGHDKLVGDYDPTAMPPCINAEYYDTLADPFELAPQTWPGIRASRLRDHFTNLHATDPASWGFGVPFC